LNAETNRCEDIDECATGNFACQGGKECLNTVGSYRCECQPGFEVSSTTGQCEDIDECSKSTYSICGLDSECQNSYGSFRCVCKPGFRLRDDSRSKSVVTSTCVDLNECDTIPGICQQRCANLWGSYRCHCRPGYRLAPDGRICVDIDECTEYQDICIGNCVNEPGSYRCTCPQGYILSSNGRSCQDIDECAEVHGQSPCQGEGQHCFNTRGGYKCVDIRCPTDYESEDGNLNRCKLADSARRCRIDNLECLRKPVSISHNFISLVSELRVTNQGVDLFTMQGASYYAITTKFNLTIKSVRASKDIEEKADDGAFRLKTPSPHRAIVSVVRPIKGPQDILLELTMERYHLGRYQATALANIYIFVTPYVF
jgi:fibulin 1/2